MPFSLLWRGKGKVAVIEAMGVGAGPQRTRRTPALSGRQETGGARSSRRQESRARRLPESKICRNYSVSLS